MIRVRRLVSTIALCAALAVVAACHKKVPAPAPAPAPSTPSTAPATPPSPPPPPAPAPAPAGRRLLRSRQVRDPRRRARVAAERRRLAEEVDEHADHARRPLRLARQRGIQPRVGIASRDRPEGLPDQPRRAVEPRDRGQQRQGTAVLQRRERVLLAAEPPRTLRDHGKIGQDGQEGLDGLERKILLPIPSAQPPPPPPSTSSPPPPPSPARSPLSFPPRAAPEYPHRTPLPGRHRSRHRPHRSVPAAATDAQRARRSPSSPRTSDTRGANRS